MVTRACKRRASRGFALVAVLLVVVAVSLAASAAVQRPQTQMKREREAQLKFVGEQYARAIAGYYTALPQAKQYPQRLEDLLEDRRFVSIKRHLRRLYPDPMTGRADWELLMQDGRIVGLHSRSRVPTLKQIDGVTVPTTYADWRFAAATITTGKVDTTAAQTDSAVQPAPVVVVIPPENVEKPVNACSEQYAAALYACSAPEFAPQEKTNCRVQAGREFRECKRAERG